MKKFWLVIAIILLTSSTAHAENWVLIDNEDGTEVDRDSIVRNGEMLEAKTLDPFFMDVTYYMANCKNNLIRMTKSTFPGLAASNFQFHAPSDYEMKIFNYICGY